MLQSLLRSLGIYENSSRLRNELQAQMDAQRTGWQKRVSALGKTAIWAGLTVFLASVALVLGLMAIYISLRQHFGPEVAIWSLLALTVVLALGALLLARQSLAATPAVPHFVVPQLYQEPVAPIAETPGTGNETQSHTRPNYYTASSAETRNSPQLDAALKDWMVKTASQTAAGLTPGAANAESLLNIVAPQAEAMAREALSDVETQIQTGSKGKIALILGTAVLGGWLASRVNR